MKNKRKNLTLPAKQQSNINSENDKREGVWRRIGLRLAAIFLVIVFLASECATVFPVE